MYTKVLPSIEVGRVLAKEPPWPLIVVRKEPSCRGCVSYTRNQTRSKEANLQNTDSHYGRYLEFVMLEREKI